MTHTKSEKSMAYYDAISRGYKELYHEEQKNKINTFKEYLPSSPSTILDLGSGDGVLNSVLVPETKLISLDISFNMLKRNSNYLKIQADCSKQLPFKNQKFDYIISLSVLQDLETPEKMISEIYRICKQEGTVILSFIHQTNKKEDLTNLIRNKFNVIKEIIEKKDLIFILKPKEI